jgi:hypothetical protein
MISSQLSMIKTRRTYSLILFCFLRPSNISKGALLGTNNTDLNSNCKSNSKPVRPQELCTSKTAHNYWVASSSEGSWHMPATGRTFLFSFRPARRCFLSSKSLNISAQMTNHTTSLLPIRRPHDFVNKTNLGFKSTLNVYQL